MNGISDCNNYLKQCGLDPDAHLCTKQINNENWISNIYCVIRYFKSNTYRRIQLQLQQIGFALEGCVAPTISEPLNSKWNFDFNALLRRDSKLRVSISSDNIRRFS